MIHVISGLKSFCVLISCLVAHVAQGTQDCEPGMFGVDCQQQCQCLASQCRCSQGVKCRPGYFGPACQYGDHVQLSALVSQVPAWLRDGDDLTCKPDPGVHLPSVTLTFRTKISLSWVRLYANRSIVANNFSIELENGSSCYNMRSAQPDNQTLDIYCDVDHLVGSLTITGHDVEFLCSIYVSLGRVVAARHWQNQSWSDQLREPLSAVDWWSSPAAESLQPSHQHRCVNTQSRDTYHFKHPSRLSAVFINASIPRLVPSSVRLDTFSFSGKLVDSLVVREGLTQIYFAKSQPVTRVSLVGGLNLPLDVCHVWLFGETDCPEWTYGPDCEWTCECSDSTAACLPSTGGCAAPCPSGLYGFNCSLPCPEDCGSGECSARRGLCVEDDHRVLTEAGYQVHAVKRSTKACPDGFYGKKCTSACPNNCQFKCDSHTGHCISCSIGFYGSQCNSTCDSECLHQDCVFDSGLCRDCRTFRHGNMCHLLCGENCYLNECNTTTGKCFSCAPGYKGEDCVLVPWNVTLFIVLLFLIPSVIACFFCCEVLSDEESEGLPDDVPDLA